jgi:hypothetical protein
MLTPEEEREYEQIIRRRRRGEISQDEMLRLIHRLWPPGPGPDSMHWKPGDPET